MTTALECPMCKGRLVESGVVERWGPVFMCDDDACPSHDESLDCNVCGGPVLFAAGSDGQASYVLRCCNPLCVEGGTSRD